MALTVSGSPVLSVVVCTHDRAELLPACLGALAAEASALVEVLVVDNASTDATPAVLSGFPVRVVPEPRLGLSHARNAGWQQARGEWVAYLDDDATVLPGWTDGMLAAVAAPATLAVAGRIRLDWPGGRPRWLHPSLEPYFTCLDLGVDVAVLPAPRFPYGANMALRRADLEALGGFDPALGRSGLRSLRSNEERELCQRLRGLRPGEVRYAGAAEVRHHVDPGRVSRRWLARRAWAEGRDGASALVSDGSSALGRAKGVGWALRELAFSLARRPRGRGWLLAWALTVLRSGAKLGQAATDVAR